MMRRMHRFCPIGLPVHVIQRGHNRTNCFTHDKDYAVYIAYLREACDKYKVSVHAWILMTNHVHLLVTPSSDNGVTRMMQWIGSNYVRYFNRTYSRSGTLWEGRFRSCLVQTDQYFLNCQRYIELNAVRAGMVNRPGEYHWSSYHTNALGTESNIIDPHFLYLALGKTTTDRLQSYRQLFEKPVPAQEIEEIRYATNKRLIYGSKQFVRHVEDQNGQRGHLLRRGPKVLNSG